MMALPCPLEYGHRGVEKDKTKRVNVKITRGSSANEKIDLTMTQSFTCQFLSMVRAQTLASVSNSARKHVLP